MRATRLHPLAEDYLIRLEAAAAALPTADRAELLTELRSHLESGLREDATDADVLNLLRDVGTPEAIVAAAVGEVGPVPAPLWSRPERTSPWGPVEVLAVLGLTVGTFLLPVVGPLIGLVLAWVSAQWTRREKVVATVLSLLPVVVLVLGAASVLVVREDSQSPPAQVEQAPVPAPEEGTS
ncbi:MAG: hypothetical protein WBQ50_09875 [Nocardioides sp.]